MPSDTHNNLPYNCSPIPPFVLVAYPELASRGNPESRQQISAVFQHNRTIKLTLDALSQPQSTPSIDPSMLTPILRLTEDILNQLEVPTAGTGLTHIIRAERKLWQENRDRLSDLLDTLP